MMTSRTTNYFDLLISLTVFGATLWLYLATLAPTVLEGDAALFQYTAHVLGVTYPTGFPTYILLGNLWLWLLPFGEVAWRMNLLSALCAAAAMPLLYHALRRLFALGFKDPTTLIPPRLAALLTIVTFATLPTFWRWATSAKTYSLNILLLSAMLYLIARATSSPVGVSKPHRAIYPLAFLLGLSISVHNTMLLVGPGVVLLAWLCWRSDDTAPTEQARGIAPTVYSILIALLLFTLPNLAYLYIPLRAEWLLAEQGRQAAIEHGLLADFYTSGLEGFIRYFSAAEFTQGVTADWGQVPSRVYPVYISELLADEIGWLGIGLACLGGGWLLLTRPRLLAGLGLIYIVPIPFVLAYGRGQQTAFLLPSFLMVAIAIGGSVLAIGNGVSALRFAMPNKPQSLASKQIASLFLLTFYILLLIAIYLWPRVEYGLNWLDGKWTTQYRVAWEDTLDHPLEPSANLIAEWGDLTSMWYLQHTEQRRPDVRGIYPPTEERLTETLSQGRPTYIAGLIDPDAPNRAWLRDIETNYHLIPWGRLVRLAPLERNPTSLLPDLPHDLNLIFNKQLQLREVDFPTTAVSGEIYPVRLTWQTLAELPPETTISLRLTQGDSKIAQLDDTLLSGWFPRDRPPAEQPILSYARLPIPTGSLPGEYRLQMVVYAHHSQPWALADGRTVLDLGAITVASPPQPRPLVTEQDFNGELRLVESNYSVSRVGQGKGFALTMVWQSHQQPPTDYTLQADLLDRQGKILRTVLQPPTLPTSQWQTGQLVRELVDVVVPASAPVGENSVQVRLQWLRPDGSTLPTRRYGLMWGASQPLAWLTVTEKEGRTFEVPEMAYPLEDVNFGDKVRLLGYDVAAEGVTQTSQQPSVEPAATDFNTLNLRESYSCQPDCQLDLTLYWQGSQEMGELYTVFLHLVDGAGNLVSQRDKVPGIRGKQPTTGWLPDEVIHDPISLPLPADLPVGAYTLRVGLYLPADWSRLPRLDEAGQIAGDFVEIGQLEVVGE